MLIELRPEAAAQPIVDLVQAVPGLTAWPLRYGERRFVVVSGDEDLVPGFGAGDVIATHSTRERGYWLVDREHRIVPDTVRVGGVSVGRGHPLWFAGGPCALEETDAAGRTATAVREAGGHALRGGLFKPRSSPYHFLGRGRSGLADLEKIGHASGLPIVTEVMDPRDVEAVAEVASCVQVDARNMHNRVLLAELGRIGRPVLLMRGLRAGVPEWLRAAEFVVAHGNPEVILCARGVVSFDDTLAFQPDLGALLAVRRLTDLPVVFDPSHCAGRADAVGTVALSAVLAGADGLMVETHVDPGSLYRPGDAHQMYPIDRLAALFEAANVVRDVRDAL
ncbi:hypothetical protein Aph01nite_70700 [Acrocarpospora phusangensis]|uniref:DAHP synthetase I/KDSA domain-containing protein n=1 Tax=Acrocarpospora phusangensis TaxID=1070424 RepID=A0A919UUV0_9ACTN|nr:3-deoxy-7-phosphoheptulonate synthase [Acrocarpospora phusangensis]GIH28760.1 hypothetical protein Aph01nite_70700 [Acrocarpospora phusangensis]